ncbi:MULTISPECIES: GtrA family protein [Xanthomonas]|nr:GtrA family protein [Xanthomonas cucurbitae]WDM68188.1 GtrA family protein [Xanthomonas cucurbitae]WDM72062.1 GtrA family protein [Xanthomonas cucurbitae]WDM75008.1 GtrA family protein [Xanthomonas cucurbitae]WDM78713.1 GtrA family protein [Xanthomonas cucurbitae]WDM82393.1 GtrA family protein [Xanthomonas cucurbitae]
MSLFRQGSQFTLIGALQLAVDCGIFIAGTAAGLPAVPANLLGRIGGAALGFWLNGRFTFARQDGARLGWQRFRRFAVMWLILTLISTWLVSATVELVGLRQAWLAKPLVEGGLAVVSFFLGRQVVYR